MVIKLQRQLDADRPFTLLAWGHWFTFANLLLALVVSFFYINVAPAPETAFGWAFLLINWVGHFAFLSLSCFILTIFPVITIFPYKRHIRGISAIMASLFQLYLFLDVLAYRGLGYHLSSSSIDQLREVEDVYLALLGSGYWILLLAVFAAILFYQFFVSNFTWKKIQLLQRFKYKNQLAMTLFVCFFSGHLMHIWADATLNTDIAKQGAMFPGSYPMTAKTLLAKHGLIDLDEYKAIKSQQTNIDVSRFTFNNLDIKQCNVENMPGLEINLIARSEFDNVKQWLNNNNLQFQHNKQLNLANDFDTTMYNFNTGLPGLYQYMDNPTSRYINHQFETNKVSIQVLANSLDVMKNIENPGLKRAFVFYSPEAESKFYRTDVILIGFPTINDIAINPQNIIATYLSKNSDCEIYVKNNLVDKGYQDLSSDDILTNYSEGYLHLIYKDKAMLFENGKLVSNTAYSTNTPVNEPISIHIVQKALQKITEKNSK